MSDQTKIATVGPADEKATTRVKIYAGLALVIPFLAFLATFNVIPAEAVQHADKVITGLVGVLGLGGFGYVANKTRNQVGNGTFEAAPENPLATAAAGISQLQDQLTETINVGLAGVKEVQDAATVLKAVLPVTNVVNQTITAVPAVAELIKLATEAAD